MSINHYSPAELANMGIKAGEGVMVSRHIKIYTAGIEIGDYTRIDDGCILMGSIKLGRRVHIAPYCVLYGKHCITIEDFSGFGAFSVFHTESDDYSGASLFGPQVPLDLVSKKDSGSIHIARGVIGGTRCTYLPAVYIAEGASIGAHSLVKNDCAEWTMYAGTPARKIRENSRNAKSFWEEL
jgi:acetyltransferase-like isoleucine patch superfamily enzyme